MSWLLRTIQGVRKRFARHKPRHYTELDIFWKIIVPSLALADLTPPSFA
jgi:hypothetical protein